MLEMFKVTELSFRYPNSKVLALDGINLTINEEDFVLICGCSGSGKTTLLKSLKPCISPKGEKSGKISFLGKSLSKLDSYSAVRDIGYLSQHADEQIICSDAIQELAFALENLSLKPSLIKLRIAETVNFFGLDKLLNKNVSDMSGGEKQLLNLASSMITQPKVLILDEPTAQLDPISANNFINAIRKANAELGTTVIIAEHNFEGLLDTCNRLIFLDKGKLVLSCNPLAPDFSLSSSFSGSDVFLSMPSSFKIFTKVCEKINILKRPPLSISEGRKWLSSLKFENNICQANKSLNCDTSDENKSIVELKHVCFRYKKNTPDILRDLSLNIPKAKILSILGSNAAGKTTLLSVISKIHTPYSGKVVIKEPIKISGLSQNPKAMFYQETVLLDLKQTLKHSPNENNISKISDVVELLKIEHLLDRHPYDLSGGELQKAALAKVLLMKPDLILLDEPSKAIDPIFKNSLIKILKDLRDRGITVVMVSHDIDFCANCADICAMLFNGEIVTVEEAKQFFSQNNFYTTSASKISRKISKYLITDEDVISFCLENLKH